MTRHRLFFSAGLLLLAAGAGGGCGGGGAAVAAVPDGQTFTPLSRTPLPLPAPATHQVRMLQVGEAYRFEPAMLTIRRGDRIRFITISGAPHNVAFEADSVPDNAQAALAAGMPDRIAPLAGPLLLQSGDSYTISFADVPPGRYPYFCMPHVTIGMKGTITVE